MRALPPFSRRACLLAAGAVLLLPLRPRQSFAQEGTPPLRLDVQRLRPNIHVASGFTNGNVLIVVSDTGVLLVDAQSLRRVAALDSAIQRITTLPVRSVVNTHYHADHTEGNSLFRQRGSAIIAQRNVRTQAMKDTIITDWENWHREPLPADALPTVVYDDSLKFAVGREPVVLYHVANAHTDGDTFVWLPRANVLHTGDVLELQAPPFIDWWAGGRLEGMIAAVDRALELTNDQTAIVPGHGHVASRDELRRYRQMLAEVGRAVGEGVARGATVEELVAARPAERYGAALGGARREEQLVRLLYYGARFTRER